MNRIYNDLTNPASLGSEKKLYESVKDDYSRESVKRFLESKDSYTLHKTNHKTYKRRRFMVSKPGKTICIDVAFMSKYKKSNNNISYLLVFIDMYSRYLTIYPLKSLQAKDVVPILKKFFDESIYLYEKCLTDRGQEFLGSAPQKLFKKIGVHHYNTFNYDIKVALVERVIKTIKNKIARLITERNSEVYLPFLDTLVDTYNYTSHRGLLFRTPLDVHLMTNDHKIIQFSQLIYKRDPVSTTSFRNRYHPNQHVRLKSTVVTQHKFPRSYFEQNTREIFKIDSVNLDHNPITYYIQDLNGEKIDGIFYKSELVPVSKPDKFEIEIIKERVRKGVEQYLIKYINYPSSPSVWLKKEELIKLV